MWCEVFRRVACVHIYHHFSLEHFEIGSLKRMPAKFHSTVTFHGKRHLITLVQMTISTALSLVGWVNPALVVRPL